MTAIDAVLISSSEVQKILSTEEGHFVDLKSMDVSPGKLTKSLSAFANADGGELYIGIDEKTRSTGLRTWRGFTRLEDANGHIQAFEQLFPLSSANMYTFLSSRDEHGYVLKIEITKSADIKFASNDKVYVRRSASNLPVTSGEQMSILRRNKGIISFETETVNAPIVTITNSAITIGFMLEVVPNAEPEPWLKKHMLIVDEKPTVAGIILFSEEPQIPLSKRSGMKIYRYKTTAQEGDRDTLDFDPVSVDGCAYEQIRNSVQMTAEIIESVRINTPTGLESVRYPVTALHEIITNAVLHRDYSIADDIHIIIFDNRVEVISPGVLPAHITPENILSERFSRNPIIVRLINKFPNPPNKDVGEGLNTAFKAMRDMKLRSPIVSQEGGKVKVSLVHETLATPEEVILEYLKSHDEIRNKTAREICYVGSENKMKRIFQKMMERNLIELVPGRSRYTAAYRLLRRVEP